MQGLQLSDLQKCIKTLYLEPNPIGKITVYGIPEIMLWKIRNQFLIYQEWYNDRSEMISDTSAMRAIPKPHQPPHLAYFDMLIVLYQNEN